MGLKRCTSALVTWHGSMETLKVHHREQARNHCSSPNVVRGISFHKHKQVS